MTAIKITDIDEALAEVRESLLSAVEVNCGKAFSNHEEAIGAITIAYQRVLHDAMNPFNATTASIGGLASLCVLVLAQTINQASTPNG